VNISPRQLLPCTTKGTTHHAKQNVTKKHSKIKSCERKEKGKKVDSPSKEYLKLHTCRQNFYPSFTDSTLTGGGEEKKSCQTRQHNAAHGEKEKGSRNSTQKKADNKGDSK